MPLRPLLVALQPLGLLLLLGSALLGAQPAGAAPAPVIELEANQTELDVVIRIAHLDRLSTRQNLTATIELAGVRQRYTIDLSSPAVGSAVLIGKTKPTALKHAQVSVHQGDLLLLRQRVSIARIDEAKPNLPLTALRAEVEAGQQPGSSLPVVQQPDLAALPVLATPPAARVVELNDLRLPVVGDVSYPLISAENNCLISRQTAHPDDPAQRSIYLPMKSQLFDAAGNPTRQMHYLVEVPLDPAWMQAGAADTLTAPTEKVRVHVPTTTWTNGKWVTGEGPGGLGQLIGSAAVDDQGNLYYSASLGDQGLVRFNIARACFEAPPADLAQALNPLLPAASAVPEALSKRRLRWDPLMYVHVAGDQLYLCPFRTDVLTDEVMLNGIIAFPLAQWDHPQAFAAGARLLALGAPGQPHSLYDHWPKPDDPPWKIAPLLSRADSLYVTAYPPFVQMGPWRIAEPADGVAATVTPVTHDEVTRAPPRPRPALRTWAGGVFHWTDYGILTTTRAKLALVLGMSTDAQAGNAPADANEPALSILYDPLGAMRLEPARYADILNQQQGPALAPCYMATAIPGRPGVILGVGEYGYYLAEYDLRAAASGVVQRRVLQLDAGGRELNLPLRAGLGPYGHLWQQDGNNLSLLLTGYTGIATMLYSQDGQVLPRHRVTVDKRPRERNLDAAVGGMSMTNTYPLPGLDQRVHLLATNSPSRNGTPWSNGLQTLTFPAADEMLRLSRLTRGGNNAWLRGRVRYDPAGRATQELVLAASPTIPAYLAQMNGQDEPPIRGPKLVFYQCPQAGEPTDRFALSLPLLEGGGGVKGMVVSADGRYLVLLHQERLLSFDLTRLRYVDGYTLPATVWEFTRPDERFQVAPDGRIFLCVCAKDADTATFYELDISPAGRLALKPHLAIHAPTVSALHQLEGGVAVFVADPANDGSYDLCLGPWSRLPGANLWLLRDFLPAPATATGRSSPRHPPTMTVICGD